MLAPDLVEHLLHQYGYAILFVAVVVEGPMATIVGAFVASQGYLDIYVTYAVAAAGDLFSDLLYYGIGRVSRLDWPTRLLRPLGITADRLALAAHYFDRHGAKMLLFAKYTQTGLLILPASGAARMPVGRFVWYNAVGTLPKTLILVLVGDFFGYAYQRINHDLVRASLVVFAGLGLAGTYVLIRSHLRVRYEDR